MKRLDAALNSLEFVLQQRLSQSSDAHGLSAEVEMLAADRAHLAEKLDQGEARANRLASANADAGRRIDKAMAMMRSVLAGEEGAG